MAGAEAAGGRAAALPDARLLGPAPCRAGRVPRRAGRAPPAGPPRGHCGPPEAQLAAGLRPGLRVAAGRERAGSGQAGPGRARHSALLAARGHRCGATRWGPDDWLPAVVRRASPREQRRGVLRQPWGLRRGPAPRAPLRAGRARHAPARPKEQQAEARPSHPARQGLVAAERQARPAQRLSGPHAAASALGLRPWGRHVVARPQALRLSAQPPWVRVPSGPHAAASALELLPSGRRVAEPLPVRRREAPAVGRPVLLRRAARARASAQRAVARVGAQRRAARRREAPDAQALRPGAGPRAGVPRAQLGAEPPGAALRADGRDRQAGRGPGACVPRRPGHQVLPARSRWGRVPWPRSQGPFPRRSAPG